jgi:hypothetical protein
MSPSHVSLTEFFELYCRGSVDRNRPNRKERGFFLTYNMCMKLMGLDKKEDSSEELSQSSFPATVTGMQDPDSAYAAEAPTFLNRTINISGSTTALGRIRV